MEQVSIQVFSFDEMILKNGINIYAILWAFTFSVIVLIQISGIAIKFKEINEITSLVTEVLEVNEGFNVNVDQRLQALNNQYPNYQITISKTQSQNMDYYHVSAEYEYQIPLINYRLPISSTKQTRRLMP